MLTLILAESALETIPRELLRHLSFESRSKKTSEDPKFTILDRSYHHTAMRTLKDSNKRGRPDIIHISLLEALGSPLNKEGLLKVYVHTFNEYVISIAPETRLPRNCNRFIGLMEDLFRNRKVPPKGTPLLTITSRTLPELIGKLKPSYVLALSRTGKPVVLEEAISRLSNQNNLAAIVGGFPFGHFTDSTVKLANEIIRIDPDMLESWIVVSRIIYEYERATSITKKRKESIDQKQTSH